MDEICFAHTRSVIFDLDGTLIDSVPDIAISINEVLKKLDLPTYEISQVRDWIGNGAARLIKRALTGTMDGEPDEELFHQARDLFFDYYEQHLNDASIIFPGVLEGLNTLEQLTIKMAIITNKPRRFTPPLLRTMQIDHYFQHIVCGDDLPKKKPDPMPLQYIMELQGLQPSQTVLVGDSASDIQAAQAADVASICVDYGYHQGKGVDALGADYIISSIEEVANLISKHKA